MTMSVLRSPLVCVTLLLVCFASCVFASSSLPPSVSFSATSGLIQLSVARSIDLRSHIEDVISTIKIKNNAANPVSTYIVAVAGEKAGRLAFIEATSADGKRKMLTRSVQINGLPKVDTESLTNASFFEVQLPKTLANGDVLELRVLQTFTRTQRPFPESIEQSEQQLVMWEDSSVFFSPYSTTTQDLSIRLASSRIENFTKKSSKRSGDLVSYGPLADTTTFSSNPIFIHFVNNSPFITFTTVSKDIEVSHWGNVAIQENYLLTHTGAKLRGEFTRSEYERIRHGEQAPASFRTLVAELPRTAKDIYYRDCIGNVSTSHVRKARDHTRMEVDPRFPMFGGWESDFHIGYNLPSQNYLSVNNNDQDQYVLNISFAVPFASAAIDSLTVRVILPEGATDIEWVTPFDIDSASFTEFKTYLDTVGRPTLILSKSNCVARVHQQNFQVSYRFAKGAILREPFLVTGAIFACLLVVMAFYHADLRITEENDAERMAANVQASPLRSRRSGTELGGRVQEILENLLAQPNGLLAVAEDRAAGIEKQTLLGSLVREIGVALKEIEKEESAFAPLVTTLTNSMNLLAKASKKYVSAAKGEAKAAREGLAEIVEQIHVQAKKLAEL